MILALDAGSTRIFGGLICDGRVLFTFMKSTSAVLTADELGVFLYGWLSVKDVKPGEIEGFVFCSVVPEVNRAVADCGRLYFNTEPLELRPGIKSGLKVRYSNHHELGADLIANAVAAVAMYPAANLIIVDFGAATSICAVSCGGEYLGGTLIPGLDIAMEALSERTAQLPAVEIRAVDRVCGRDAVSGIQGGLYFGTLGMLKELISRISRECFGDGTRKVIATGSYAGLYEKYKLFDSVVPELVLLGLERIRSLNLN